jgi:putative oxidoreductase
MPRALRHPRTIAILLLAGRVLTTAIFLREGYATLARHESARAFAWTMHVPEAIPPLIMLLEFGCGAFLLVGLFTRATAAMLAALSLLTAYYFHVDIKAANQVLYVDTNLALAGGFLALAANGAGRYAVEWMINPRCTGVNI